MTKPAIQYTPEQKIAIEARNVSIALAAGAGCGKTFVLTERFLAELAPNDAGAEQQNEPNPEQRLSELVAITFTDAAARELRSRIRNVVRTRIDGASPSEQNYWRQLQRALDACRVSTIHSLCGTLLRSHAFEVGLDPLFAVLDQSSSLVLRTEAIEDTLRQTLAVRDPLAFELASTWGIEGLKKRIAGLIDQHRGEAFARWLEKEPADAITAWERFYREEVWPAACADLGSVGEELIVLVSEFAPENAEASGKKEQFLSLLRTLVDGSASMTDLEAIQALARANRKPFTKKTWGDDALFERFKETATRLRDAIKALPNADFTSASAHRSAELGLHLARLTQLAADAYRQAKESLGALDYDDLIATAHRLLTDEAHRDTQDQIRGKIRLLMVDEFQDTDRLQVEIVKALAGEIQEAGKLFFVGDDKQSIYRFRGAEPKVFLDLRSEVAESWRLPLSMNFRSQPAILNFVNSLAGDLFTGGYQPLSPSRPQVTPEPAIEFRWTVVEGNRNVAGWKARSRQAEARSIAVRLRELFDGDAKIVADPGAPEGCRPAQPGDVALLFRVLSDVQYYEAALREQKIDYYLVGGHAFYTQQEVYDLLHLLRSIASSCDELSLAGVLRSPFFSLADESLFWLTARGRSLEAGLFAERPPKELEALEREKVTAAANTLRYLRSIKEQVSLSQLLAEAFERTGFDAALLADFMGERKLANVEKLVEQARLAGASGVGSLDDFVTQLAEFTTSAPKEALAATTPETANVVRLMTIHQAKGLEFPVVIVPDVDRDKSSHSVSVAFHRDLGPLVKEPEADKTDASGLRLFGHFENLEEAAESNRLLYVACTRAADYLLLSSGVNDLEKPSGPWLKRLAESFDLREGKLLSDRSGDANRSIDVNVVSPTTDRPFSSGAKRPPLPKLLEQAKMQAGGQAEIQTKVSPESKAAALLEVDPSWRRRFSVTRLSGQIVRAGGDLWRGEAVSAARNSALDPLSFGTLVHAVLERADFAHPETIDPWCHTLAPLHHPLAAAEAATAARELVEKFFQSRRAEEMRSAQKIHHEVEFLLAWPPGSKVNTSETKASKGNGRYLQGYLDCLYQGADGVWRVIDYKTNLCNAEEVPPLAAKYALQMAVYALAVEQTWGTGPDELVLHFLRPGMEQVTPWNRAARQQAIELVEQALAGATT